MSFRVGDWVEVRSEEEILGTLDPQGRFEELPFMPQMAAHCGRRYRVTKRAHKLCDTVNATGGRRMRHAVFLDELRCDGVPYGGCEMDCRFFWKEAWLKRASGPAGEAAAFAHPTAERTPLVALAWKHTRQPGHEHEREIRYSCQATAMPEATTHLSVWDARQYVEDYRSGNATLSQIGSVLFFLVFNTIAGAGLGIGSAMRWVYERVRGFGGRATYPTLPGRLPMGARTPSQTLDLKPGEVVRVKPHEVVLDTLTEDWKNRGLGFHPEMVPHCEATFHVERRLRRLLNEKTGHLVELKNPCIVLQGAPCVGNYTRPLLCPRGMAPYWREIWLERVGAGAADAARPDCHVPSPERAQLPGTGS